MESNTGRPWEQEHFAAPLRSPDYLAAGRARNSNLAVRGGVRLGIDAPPEITILREEVPDKAVEWKTGDARAADPKAGEVNPGKFLPALRKQLRATGVALGVLRIQFDTGQIAEARGTLARMQSDFQLFLHGVDGELERSSAKTSTRFGQPQKTLLVEDDRNERELLAGFLRHSGLAVDTAGDGATWGCREWMGLPLFAKSAATLLSLG